MNYRWIIAAVIAIGAVVAYFGKTQINPVTGEKQRVDLSFDQEMALGLEAAPQMASKMGGVLDPRADPRAGWVEEIGRRLVERTDASKSPYKGNFHFYLLKDPETINAFALPGGQIFITLGLYNKLESSAELAGVLGHEVGHVINRHAAEHMAKGDLGNKLALAVGVGASDDRGHGAMAAAAAQMANQMFQLKFSRDDESESDKFGLQYMSQAGFDPRGMLRVMEILRDSSKGGRQPEMLATHPLPENRLTETGKRIEQMFPNGVPKDLTEGEPLPK
jgi:predicted Zn-dependent protease